MERKILKLTLIFLLTLFVPVCALAKDEAGGVENVFSYGTGLRAIGMGSAFIAMTDDPYLGYWNPGATAYTQYREVAVFGTRLIADAFYFSGFYTNPTLNIGTFSVGGIGVYSDGIESYDENASPITDASTSYFHSQILFSYGYGFRWGLGIGGTAKIEQMRITDYKGTGASFDIGVYYHPQKVTWLSVGAVVQDLYSTGIKLLEEFERNTRVYKLGAATTFYTGSENTIRLSFALDGRFFTDNYNPDSSGLIFDLSVGGEVAFSEWLMFRAGMKNIYFRSFFQGFPAGLSLGFTLRQWGFGFDYAVTFEDSDAQNALDLLMRVGLSYRFGMSIEEKRAKELERLQLQIEEEIREATSLYESQLEKLTQDYEVQRQQLMDEMNRQNQERLAAIEKTIAEVRQQTISELSEQFKEDKKESQEELTNVYEQQINELERRLLDEKDLSEQQRDDLGKQIQQLTAERTNVELQLKNLQERLGELVNVLSVQFEEEKRKSLEDLSSQYEQQRIELEQQLIEERSSYEQQVGNLQRRFKQERDQLSEGEAFKSEQYSKGLGLFSEGRYEEALEAFEGIASIDANYLKVQEYIQRSKAEMRDVASYSKEIMDLYHSGLELFVNKKYTEAIAEWEKILEIDPYNKLALRNIQEARNRLIKLEELGTNE
jgi:tetratricopeptide (TPR) repeat protein